jgi:guanylate kinase
MLTWYYFLLLLLSVAQTTRKPRSYEKQKVDYNFISLQEFEQEVTQVGYFWVK